jgi:methylthioribose-1-phosphate isomerase
MNRIKVLTPITWSEGTLRLLDQTLLPGDEVWLTINDHRELADAIRSMRIRGAPAIGVAAACGLALVAQASEAKTRAQLLDELRSAANELRSTRPTAVNLPWALDRVLTVAERSADVASMHAAVVTEAQRIQREDIEGNQRLGRLGAELLPDDVTVLTHCNAGALATAGYGTALGVVRAAVEMGKRVRVVATETRPLLQGARLTAWELARDEIDCTLIVDGAAGALMRRGSIDAVVVGADRIAANGDVANKIGTYTLAVLAREHDVPFYVAAPVSTIDLSISSGDGIAIEERSPDEVTNVRGWRVAAEGVEALNPAFDVTLARFVSAIITERGVARSPYVESLRILPQAVEAHA